MKQKIIVIFLGFFLAGSGITYASNCYHDKKYNKSDAQIDSTKKAQRHSQKASRTNLPQDHINAAQAHLNAAADSANQKMKLHQSAAKLHIESAKKQLDSDCDGENCS